MKSRPKTRECHLCRLNDYRHIRATRLCLLRYPNGFEVERPLCLKSFSTVRDLYLVEWEPIRLIPDDSLQLKLFDL